MTKFEEEVKRPKKAYIDPFSKRDVDFTGVAKKFTEGAQTLKEWKEYAFVLEDKLKLQQQALPVVPECVGEFIEDCKKEGDCLFGVFADATRVEHDMPDLVYFWLGDEGNNDELFARAWLDGYTVEKPQLFYLREKNTNYYLNKSKNNGLELVPNPYFDEDNQFTKQEIDSMQTGSYELVPVEDGE
ncbi:DUF1642 domain-containing protein [Lactococcus lactis]|uniref:DUF1642 domain-containing protein n=1 Tax=Lactococcus lactis TaxID=1358 RepID=UPI001D066A39|nr:DUF1642 domain-containing protein [Lactococcus lactis]MCB6852859.1 DUF1642 domain-containing protein [Lactococcus lactis]MDU6581880.1 DUF1642 domain-containing protein [Lactococcus lactis]